MGRDACVREGENAGVGIPPRLLRPIKSRFKTPRVLFFRGVTAHAAFKCWGVVAFRDGRVWVYGNMIGETDVFSKEWRPEPTRVAEYFWLS